jgi:glycosyltransferase involved in cell wall biosynthesis
MVGPRVTVLMPVYNAERHLREAINSILDQSFRPFEFLVIDDGSTDRSADIIAHAAIRGSGLYAIQKTWASPRH